MDRFDRWIRDLLDSGQGWWIVALVFVLVAVLFSEAANGEPMAYVAKDNLGNKVSLYNRPCEVEKIKAVTLPEWRDKLRAGQLVYKGKILQACWAIGPDGKVHFLDEELDLSVIPIQVFKADEGV